jgi:hypothetical protein
MNISGVAMLKFPWWPRDRRRNKGLPKREFKEEMNLDVASGIIFIQLIFSKRAFNSAHQIL